ncbi:MAG: hypothetical protein ACK5HY_18355 [Parahaliea sp.]
MFALFTPRRRVLAVCRANLCRSPMVESILQRELHRRGLQGRFRAESAGSEVAMIGRRPDVRAQRALERAGGADMSRHRARSIKRLALARYDYILAVDNVVYEQLYALTELGASERLQKLMAYAPQGLADELPDPYFGPESGFQVVLDMLEATVPRFLDSWVGEE